MVGLITEWVDDEGNVETAYRKSDLGGTMRLGGQLCHPGRRFQGYVQMGNDTIYERHRHRYEVNNPAAEG